MAREREGERERNDAIELSLDSSFLSELSDTIFELSDLLHVSFEL